MPATVGSWFARDLVRSATVLVEAGRVALRSVEDLSIEATVTDVHAAYEVCAEWGAGTGPLALHAVCGCGESGICRHIVATLEAVRSQTRVDDAESEIDLSWLPAPAIERKIRARAIWPVFSSPDGSTLGAALVLDSPRLRGAIRDAAAVAAMMDATPLDDWDDVDRELMRDESVNEAFTTGRTQPRALARALLRLVRHPRLRFDADPSLGRHPSELPPFRIDLRGISLRVTRQGNAFAPLFESVAGDRLEAKDALVLDGPPTWVAWPLGAYLVDGAFDPKKAIAAARSLNGTTSGPPPGSRTIARVAPFLTLEDRGALGIDEATDPSADIALGWIAGALIANLTFIDRATGVAAPYAALGAIAPHGERFVRFSAHFGSVVRERLLTAGFVPRSADGFALHGADRAARFIRETLPGWTDFTYRLDAPLAEFAAGKSDVDISVRATRSGSDADWFELKVDVFVGGDGEALSDAELSALMLGAGRFAEVRGKLVDVDSLRQRNDLLADLTARRRSGLAALLALRDELHDSFASVELPPEVERMRERLRNFEGIPAVEPPSLTGGELRGYQERGLDFLSYLSEFAFGGILADEMGLGKTVQVLSYLLRRKQHDGRAPSLVIAPTSVTHTWESEIARFAPSLRTLRLHSGSDRVARYEEIVDCDVIVTSYALARLDAERLAQYRFRTLILDEAQNAKNPSSQIARVVRGLHAEHRLALTGTPVENSLRDLWAIFSFLEPGLLGSEASFRKRFELPIAQNDARASAALRSRLEPFLLRRTKEDVAPELPDRTEIELACDLSPLQRRLYRGVAEAARRDILPLIDAGGIGSATVHVLAALTRLRQICAHPGLLLDEYSDAPEASAKFDAFLETVEEILSGGHRLLVFSAFTSMLRIIRGELDRRGIAYGYLDGSTKDKDRQHEVARFMAADGPPLFLCSLKAGGVGLTLTAADYVILYDPWWNPAVERQAIDRTHRIGQHRNVTAYRLVTSGTVEEKMRALARRKSALSANIIKAEGAFAKTLRREDLELLLADPGD